MTLYWNCIALVTYEEGMLEIHALNPEVRTRWVMRRLEMLGLGLSCIWAAIRPRSSKRAMR